MQGTCWSCGAKYQPQAKFCHQCGHSLPKFSPGSTTTGEDKKSLAAERRQISVVFYDLVGSTDLAIRLDPEELRETLASYRSAIAATVEQYDGSIAQFLGDGVLAYFGYPQSHENDTENAIRASLEIRAKLAQLRAGGNAISIRAGVATGLVVVGAQVGAEQSPELLAVGQTPHLAARLQEIARPGEVIVSDKTQKLTKGLFDFQKVSVTQMKGFQAESDCYAVLGLSDSVNRFDAQRFPTLVPFVGRHLEIEMLKKLWRDAQQGNGQLAVVTGEAGIGKSRIVHQLASDLGSSAAVLRCSCSPYTQNTALQPFVAMIVAAAGIEREDPVALKRKKLLKHLENASPLDRGASLTIADLLGLRNPKEDGPPIDEPVRLREATLSALLSYIGGISKAQPALLIFEDAHWSDASSIELLSRILEQFPDRLLLTLITYRPEFQHKWSAATPVTTIHLDRLQHGISKALMREISGGERLPDEVAKEIVRRTDGIPLFIEEFTRTVLLDLASLQLGEQRPADWTALIPESLSASLTSRLDKLGGDKEIAQIASVAGREISHRLLEQLVESNGGQLSAAITRLLDSGLMVTGDNEQTRAYRFKHSLIRDAAYETLLKSRRQELHGKTAKVIESSFPDTARMEPELLAHHYTEARVAPKAVFYWSAAGQIAASRSASVEALSHASKGLKLIPELPADATRDGLELSFQCILGPALVDTAGHSAEETVSAFERARVLMDQTGDTARRDEILTGLSNTYNNRAEYRKSMKLREYMLELAEASGDRTSLCAAHRGIASLSNIFGNFELAKIHGEKALTLYDPEKHAPLAWRFVHDLGVSTESQLAITLWHLGEFKRSRALSVSAIHRAYQLGHANTLGYALSHNGFMNTYLKHDVEELKKSAAGLLAIKHARGSLPWDMWGRYMQFFAHARSGASDEAFSEMTKGLAARDRMRNRAVGSTISLMAAEVHSRKGDFNRALEAIDNCIVLAETTGEQWMLAEIMRIKADIVLASGMTDAANIARTSMEQSLDIARKQRSRVFELRTATSLAELLHAKGPDAESFARLASLVESFPEDEDIADLRKARDFLRKISGHHAGAR